MKRLLLALFLLAGSLSAGAAEIRTDEIRVMDGDTVEAWLVTRAMPDPYTEMIHRHKVKIRFLELDTWETRRIWRDGVKVTEAEVVKGKAAKAYLSKLLKGHAIRVMTDHKYDGRGRLLGTLWRFKENKWQNITTLMKKAGKHERPKAKKVAK